MSRANHEGRNGALSETKKMIAMIAKGMQTGHQPSEIQAS
jgi:hypothetical protein